MYQIIIRSNKSSISKQLTKYFIVRLQRNNIVHHTVTGTAFKRESNLNLNLNSNSVSTISDFILPEATLKFKRLCYIIGIIISLSSIVLLKQNLLFGTSAGIIAKTCTAPLERLTTHRQASIDKNYSLYSVIRVIYNDEGIYGFWRGNGVNVLRASLQKGSLFALTLHHILFPLLSLDTVGISHEIQDVG